MHTPKAGGSSFKSLLKDHFQESFKDDYFDFPLNFTETERNKAAERFLTSFKLYKSRLYQIQNVKCIHGHFMPYKYSSLLHKKEILFITWLRDPIERLLSHYYYWLRSYDEKNSQKLHKRVVEENWSLETFCFSEEMQNVYSKFLWQFPIQNFDFIGITEYFEEDFLYFTDRYLGFQATQIPYENVNRDKINNYFLNKELIKKVREFHAEDYKIYNYALDKRNERLQAEKM